MQTRKIISSTQISEELFVLEISYDQDVQAGQFFMLKINDQAHILPRPISIFQKDSSSISFLIRKRGFGSEALSQIKPNQEIQLFGSLGKGFDVSMSKQNCLLISGGEGIAPMLLLSEQLKQQNQIRILAGFRHKAEATTLNYFDKTLSQDFTALDHDDPSHQGFVTDLLDQEKEPDIIYTCGPLVMMQAVFKTVRAKHWKSKIYISMESHMACGVGACMGCTTRTTQNSPVKICTDGPVFLAEEIFHA